MPMGMSVFVGVMVVGVMVVGVMVVGVMVVVGMGRGLSCQQKEPHHENQYS